jgi:hypothetical protein
LVLAGPGVFVDSLLGRLVELEVIEMVGCSHLMRSAKVEWNFLPVEVAGESAVDFLADIKKFVGETRCFVSESRNGVEENLNLTQEQENLGMGVDGIRNGSEIDNEFEIEPEVDIEPEVVPEVAEENYQMDAEAPALEPEQEEPLAETQAELLMTP